MTLPETDPPPDPSDALALDRTWLAMERTLLAWLRTSLTLITFGITLHHLFRLRDAAGPGGLSPSQFGFGMIAIGLVGLALAALQFRRNTGLLSGRYPGWAAPASYTLYMVGFVCLLGLAGLISILLSW